MAVLSRQMQQIKPYIGIQATTISLQYQVQVLLQHIPPGIVTITAKSAYNMSLQASCTLNIQSIGVNGLILSYTSLTLNAGQPWQLIATVLPSGASNKTVSWSSSNSSIVSVSSTGLLTANYPGSAVITAISAYNPNIYATCTVNVIPNLTLNSTSVVLNTLNQYNPGNVNTFTIIPTVNPSNSVITYYPSDSTLLSVSSNGVITALKAGTGYVVVIATYNSIAASQVCYVDVFKDPYDMGWNYFFRGTYAPTRIYSAYGYRGSDFHDGFDIDAESGTPLYSVTNGKVTQTGNDLSQSSGNFIQITTTVSCLAVNEQLKLRYCHMKDAPTLEVNTTVTPNTIIGSVGTTGSSTGNHLHLGVWPNSKYG